MDALIRLAQRCWRPVYRLGRPIRRWRDRRRVAAISATDLVERQRRLFATLGWDYDAAATHAEAVAGVALPHSHRSDHYAAFAAIAQAPPRPVRRILEIGTSSGEFAVFLSRLFPDAEIHTIDLPSDDPRFFNATSTDATGTPSAAGPAADRRDALLATRPAIRFEAMNSLQLTFRGAPEYDLIWVDGDHTFPIVAIDLANALRLVHVDGMVLCDDVVRGPRAVLSAPKWGYRETEDSLRAIEAAGLAVVSYVLKRTTAGDNLDARRMKYVAVLQPR